MAASDHRLRAYAPRTLSMLAGVVHGSPCDVQLTDDLRRAATVVCRDRQLLFDPDRATLGHLLLGASLLRHRGQVEATAGRVDRGLVRRWLAASAQELLRRFPAIPHCIGPLPTRGFHVSWDQVRVRPRRPEDFGRRRHVLLDRSLDVRGAGDPLGALLAAAEQGYLKEHPMPDFPELSIRYESVRATPVVSTEADAEQLRKWYAAAPDIVADGVRCYRDSAQTIRQEPGPMQNAGADELLDPVRLHDAFVAARLGLELPPALEPESEPVRRFDPDKYVVVFAFDLAGLPNRGLMQPSPTHGLLTVFLRIMQVLGVAVRVVGYWDHLVERPGQPSLYVSSETIVKDFDEPFDDGAALRCMHALAFGGREHARSACFPPWHFERIREVLLAEVTRRGDCQAQVYYFGSRAVPRAAESKRRMDERVAAHVDRVMAAVQQELRKECDGLSHLAAKTVDAAAEPGWLLRTKWKW